MKLQFQVITVLAAVLLLGACSKPEEKAPEFTSDLNRPLGQTRFSFSEEKQSLKFESLSTSEIAELMACNEKSSAERLERKKFTVGFGVVSRAVMQDLRSLRNEFLEFSTENREEVYEATSSILEHILGGQNVILAGPLAFRDVCTVSKGCDQEKRKYLVGSATALINMKAREKAIIRELELNRPVIDCAIQQKTNLQQVVQKGQIRIGGQTYRAVQLTQTYDGKIYCGGDYLGEGKQLSKQVFLLDLLASGKMTAARIALPVSTQLGCSRTQAFNSSELIFQDNTVAGSSVELVDYQVSGNLPSLEEWKSKQSSIKARVAELKNEVALKRSNHDRNMLQLREAETNVSTMDAKVTDLKAQLNDAILNNKPTVDALRQLLKDAEAAAISARERVTSAKSLAETSAQQLTAADEALRAYVAENGTGA